MSSVPNCLYLSTLLYEAISNIKLRSVLYIFCTGFYPCHGFPGSAGEIDAVPAGDLGPQASHRLQFLMSVFDSSYFIQARPVVTLLPAVSMLILERAIKRQNRHDKYTR